MHKEHLALYRGVSGVLAECTICDREYGDPKVESQTAKMWAEASDDARIAAAMSSEIKC